MGKEILYEVFKNDPTEETYFPDLSIPKLLKWTRAQKLKRPVPKFWKTWKERFAKTFPPKGSTFFPKFSFVISRQVNNKTPHHNNAFFSLLFSA